MQYEKRAANGHAGQYFFAYKISRILSWPCRLIDVDIGIDAQVEILNSRRSSVGRFVAVQIKARENAQTDIYVSQAHIEYWKELEMPVIAALVDLKDEEIYLHEIDPKYSYPITPSGDAKISFDFTKDLFDASKAELFEQAGRKADIAKVHAKLQAPEKYVAALTVWEANYREKGGAIDLLVLLYHRTTMRDQVEFARGLATKLEVAEDDVQKCHSQMTDVLDRIRHIMLRSDLLVSLEFTDPKMEEIEKSALAFTQERTAIEGIKRLTTKTKATKKP
jgi:Domain of unknown function (DUF4365)